MRTNGCVVCQTLQAREHAEELWIYQDDLVLLGQTGTAPQRDAGYPGHLLLVPCRHVESPASLELAEAEAIGRWLALGSRLLETVRGAEHVYLLRLGDGWSHVHFHFLPRYRGTPEKYWGAQLRDWPDAPAFTRQELTECARELREAARSLLSHGSPATG